MKKAYVLQRDLPNVPAGAPFEENDFGDYNCVGLPSLMYNKKDVEDNPTWFMLYEVKEVRVSGFGRESLTATEWYHFHSDTPIYTSKYDEITEAIAKVISTQPSL
jgi:hypothetical protein